MSVKVAVIGAGSMGLNHLRVLRDFPEDVVELVGVAETHEPSLARAISRFHIAGFTDYHQMLNQVRPDLVSVVVPTNAHFEVAAAVLKAGCHVLIEKPITATSEEAIALLKLAAERDRKIAVGHVERFNPAVMELKRYIAAGNLGQIFTLHARRVGPFPPRIRDVGVILDLATHDLDVMRYLTNAEVEYVYAESQQRVHQTHEDLLLGLIRFSNRAIGVLDVNWLTPTKVRELSVTCERGMYLVNYLSQDLYFYENDYTTTTWDALRSITGVSEGTMTRLKVQKAEPLRREYEDIFAALRDDTEPTVSGKDGLAVLHLAHQFIKATQSREVIVCSTPIHS
ncbi:MAG TPA: Gfo/Idh/MocA family oxidoreductase [Ktedonobacterales bacterium]|jgi:predicted dehydrogenase